MALLMFRIWVTDFIFLKVYSAEIITALSISIIQMSNITQQHKHYFCSIL